jgi:glycosyltransferase involved in cell wall biosynthesis
MSQVSPFFSIIIPTYNRAQFITKTIHSVLQQDFADFELLVIDDGSKDNTGELVQAFTDPRVRYLKKDNGERGAARNYGASRASGRYINFFDSDDLLYPNHLSVARQVIETESNPEFFHLAYDHQLEDGTVVERVNNFGPDTKQLVLFNNRLSCNGVFVRTDIVRSHPFEENRTLASSEDWVLWIQLLSRFELHISNEITSSVVNHDQRSLRTIDAKKVETRDLFMIDLLRKDPEVMKTYGNSFNKFVAERYTFLMLCFSEQGHRAGVWKWARAAAARYLPIVWSKRFLASIKNIIFSKRSLV